MKFIKIFANRTITVTPNLQYLDLTDYSGNRGKDALQVRPLWHKTAVKVLKGNGYYPNEIKDWESVKAMVKANIFVLGEETNTADDDGNTRLDNFETAKKEVEQIKKSNPGKFVSLDEATKGKKAK